jgi:hypothetical protein
MIQDLFQILNIKNVLLQNSLGNKIIPIINEMENPYHIYYYTPKYNKTITSFIVSCGGLL